MAEFIQGGNDLIVLDLSSIDFIDSSGLGAIVSGLKQLGGKGNLVISGAGEAVAKLFRMTRMDRVFQMFDSEPEAVKSIKG